MSLQQQQALEETYVMHTFGRKPVELVEGQGMVVRDSEGRAYLDFIGGIGVIILGHCHPALVKALSEQAARLMHVSNYYYIEGRGELAEKIGITPANLSILKTGKAKAVRFSTLDAICRALDCQPGDILEYTDQNQQQQ